MKIVYEVSFIGFLHDHLQYPYQVISGSSEMFSFNNIVIQTGRRIEGRFHKREVPVFEYVGSIYNSPRLTTTRTLWTEHNQILEPIIEKYEELTNKIVLIELT